MILHCCPGLEVIEPAKVVIASYCNLIQFILFLYMGIQARRTETLLFFTVLFLSVSKSPCPPSSSSLKLSVVQTQRYRVGERFQMSPTIQATKKIKNKKTCNITNLVCRPITPAPCNYYTSNYMCCMQSSLCGEEYVYSVCPQPQKPDCLDSCNKEQARGPEPSNKPQLSLIDTLSVHEE